MTTNWKTICIRVAEKLELPEKEVINEIETFYEISSELIRGKLDVPAKVDVDLLIGKMKPMNREMNTIKKRNPNSVWFHKYFPKWKEIVEKGRAEIKGTYKVFDNDKNIS